MAVVVAVVATVVVAVVATVVVAVVATVVVAADSTAVVAADSTVAVADSIMLQWAAFMAIAFTAANSAGVNSTMDFMAMGHA